MQAEDAPRANRKPDRTNAALSIAVRSEHADLLATKALAACMHHPTEASHRLALRK